MDDCQFQPTGTTKKIAKRSQKDGLFCFGCGSDDLEAVKMWPGWMIGSSAGGGTGLSGTVSAVALERLNEGDPGKRPVCRGGGGLGTGSMRTRY